ncbi:MAG TPA: cytochrome c oxidase subunit II [Candidatus Polarisedimenticolia bacterium]|nr:cytochrome c oxidase subunit II [Candidatus Polarisedimenticolia bacterium]
MLKWLPENVSTYGGRVDDIFYLIFYITAISCVLVLLGLVYFIFKYRARQGGRAVSLHGNTTLEILWTIVPAAVFVMLGFMSRAVWSDIRYTLPETDLRVKVTGSQFNWLMTYPGLDGQLGTQDDVTQENLLHAPVNRPVRVVLASKDVIHSFFLPHFRLKQDAVPGREIEVWFEATRTGRYEIPCAELCGFGHSNMKGYLKVDSAEEFETWAREKKAFP